MADLVLQIQPFLPEIPWQLPVVLLFAGFACLFIAVSIGVGYRFIPGWRSLRRGPRYTIATLWIVGILFAAFPTILQHHLVTYAIYLRLLGDMLLGAVTARAITKFYNSLVQSSSDSGGLLSGALTKFLSKMVDRLVKSLLLLFISLAGLVTMTTAALQHNVPTALRMIAITFLIMQVGTISVTTIYATKDAMNRFLRNGAWGGVIGTLGIIAIVAGSGIFGYPALFGSVQIAYPVLESPTGELAVQFAGSLARIIGAIVALLVMGIAKQFPPDDH